MRPEAFIDQEFPTIMKKLLVLTAMLLIYLTLHAHFGAAGAGINAVNCATSADGTVVGVGNPHG
jgi:hypothetical protein